MQIRTRGRAGGEKSWVGGFTLGGRMHVRRSHIARIPVIFIAIAFRGDTKKPANNKFSNKMGNNGIF